jgi:hypothetical protein
MSTAERFGSSPPRALNGTGRARALATAIGLVIVSSTAWASGASFELTWSAPATCPSNVAIVEATRARLGEETPDAAAQLFVNGTVQAVSGGVLVALVLRDVSGQAVGERELRVEGSDCAAIEEPVSLVLAMVIAAMRPVPPAFSRR